MPYISVVTPVYNAVNIVEDDGKAKRIRGVHALSGVKIFDVVDVSHERNATNGIKLFAKLRIKLVDFVPAGRKQKCGSGNRAEEKNFCRIHFRKKLSECLRERAQLISAREDLSILTIASESMTSIKIV